MGWALYDSRTDLYDGVYTELSDARFYRMVSTVCWKDSVWEIIEISSFPRNRFHGDHQELLAATYGTRQNKLLARVQEMNLSFTNLYWIEGVLVFETVRNSQ